MPVTQGDIQKLKDSLKANVPLVRVVVKDENGRTVESWEQKAKR